MKDIPKATVENCRHCGKLKSTVWTDDGFTITQNHEKDCPILIELRAKYSNK
jgi:hypothetical protein